MGEAGHPGFLSTSLPLSAPPLAGPWNEFLFHTDVWPGGIGISGASVPLNSSFWFFSFRKPATPAGPLAASPMVRGPWAPSSIPCPLLLWSMSLHEARRP